VKELISRVKSQEKRPREMNLILESRRRINRSVVAQCREGGGGERTSDKISGAGRKRLRVKERNSWPKEGFVYTWDADLAEAQLRRKKWTEKDCSTKTKIALTAGGEGGKEEAGAYLAPLER